MDDSTAFSIPAAAMVPSHRTLRQQRYVVTGGAVQFAPGESGEIILSGAVMRSYPVARYRLVGHSLSGAPSQVEVKLSLRRASMRDGKTSTVVAADDRILTLNGIDFVSSASKRFEIDAGTALYWVQFQLKVPKTVIVGKGERWGLLGVALFRDGSKADPLR